MDLLAVMSDGFSTDKSEGSYADIIRVTELEGTIDGTGLDAQQQNIEIYRGDSRTFEVTVKDENGDSVSITGASIKFSVKERISDTGYVIQKTSVNSNEINIVDANNGEFEIYLVPSDTQDLDRKLHEYDCELTTNLGSVYTIIRGVLKVLKDTTRP